MGTFTASMIEMKQQFGMLVSTVNQLTTNVNGLQNSVRTVTVEHPVLPSTASLTSPLPCTGGDAAVHGGGGSEQTDHSRDDNSDQTWAETASFSTADNNDNFTLVSHNKIRSTAPKPPTPNVIKGRKPETADLKCVPRRLTAFVGRLQLHIKTTEDDLLKYLEHAKIYQSYLS